MHVVDIHDEISAGDGRGKREEGSEEEDQINAKTRAQKLSRLLELYTLLLPLPGGRNPKS
jgi:hypothetical protein